MSWQHEHGTAYAVPDAIAMAEGLIDSSWHNDVCPKFEAYVRPGDPELSVEIWVDHPDTDMRENYFDGGRFIVTITAWNGDDEDRLAEAGCPIASCGDEVLATDNAEEAVRCLVDTLIKVREVVA